MGCTLDWQVWVISSLHSYNVSLVLNGWHLCVVFHFQILGIKHFRLSHLKQWDHFLGIDRIDSLSRRLLKCPLPCYLSLLTHESFCTQRVCIHCYWELKWCMSKIIRCLTAGEMISSNSWSLCFICRSWVQHIFKINVLWNKTNSVGSTWTVVIDLWTAFKMFWRRNNNALQFSLHLAVLLTLDIQHAEISIFMTM